MKIDWPNFARMFVVAYLVAMIAFCLYLQSKASAPLFPDIPIEEYQLEQTTTIEVSENGTLWEPAVVPFGSSIHVIISNGVIEVRLNETKIPIVNN